MENTRNSTNLLSTDHGNLKREKIRTIPITLIDSANGMRYTVRLLSSADLYMRTGCRFTTVTA